MYEPTYDIETLKQVFPEARNTTVTIGEGGLIKTLDSIVKLINYNYKKLTVFADKLKGDDLNQTCFNIWHFLKTQTEYQKDTPGTEELRTPQRTISEKKGDCDDYSIFSAAVLKALGYKPFLYVVAFGQNEYGHIYTGVNDFVVDGVMNEFNLHPDGISKTMIVGLNGQRKEYNRSPKTLNISQMIIQELAGLPYEMQSEMINSEYERLSGLENPTEIESEDFTKIRTLKLLEGDGLRAFVGAIAPVVSFDEELNVLAPDEEDANQIDNLYDEYVNISGLGDVDGLGKLFDKIRKNVNDIEGKKTEKKDRKTGAKIKAVVKKVTGAVKKVSFAPARGAMLLLLKMNVFGWGSRLWLSYLPENKIKEYDMDTDAFKKLVEFRKKFESFWEKAGGNKKAIFAAVSGRGKKKAEQKYLNGLGMVTTAAIGASVASASPFLVFLKNAWTGLKIVFKNLFKKGGLKTGAAYIKEAYDQYKKAAKDTDAEQDDLLAKSNDGSGIDTETDPGTTTNDNPLSAKLLIPAAIAAALLFRLI